MKQIILYCICWLITGGVIAQEQFRIPDFAKIPEEQRFDSINQWYLNTMIFEQVYSLQEKLQMLNEAYNANQSGDNITKVALRYSLGQFYTLSSIDSIKGVTYMNEALGMAKQYGLQYEEAICLYDFGVWLFPHDPVKGLEYMLRADETIERLGVSQKPGSLRRRYGLGTTYFHLRNYQACIQTLVSVLRGMGDNGIKIDLIQINNTLGLAYREKGNNDSALFYFGKVLALAREVRNQVWTGIAGGNIASIYLKQKRLDSALVYAGLESEYKNDSHLSGVGKAEALLLFALIHMEQHKPDLALTELLQAEKLVMSKSAGWEPEPGTWHVALKIYYALSEVYHEKGSHQPADLYLQKALKLQSELSYKDNAEIYTRIQEQLEAEKNISKLKDVEDAIRLSEQRRNFSIAGLCLTGLIFFSLYRRQQSRNRKNKELFESREQLLFLEKKRAEENLGSYMENLQQKNMLIEHVEKEIELLGEYSPEKQDMFEVLNKLKQSSIITPDNWTQFKALFERVYPGFFLRVKEKFPDVTPAEMRMMALIKLDISKRQMADMLGVSPETIRKTKYRFVKKINDEDNNLLKIVNSL